MPAFTASAPGKIILFGEHAVVYGQPAIAAPVMELRARATLTPNPRGRAGEVRILAPAVGLDSTLAALPRGNPLGEAIRGVAAALGVDHLPACTLKISSTIPVASGLGSGAAVSVAVIRAVAGFLGQPLSDEQVSALAYEIEKIHHGTPSGIDNSVVTFATPVYFVKGYPIEPFTIAQPFTIVIGDTGIPSPTRESVGDVRRAWLADPARYEAIFAAVGNLVRAARQAIEAGTPETLGPLMDKNQGWLQALDVSSPALDCLVAAAKTTGALGAKLCGGGRGGNMIALATPESADKISQALRQAGARRTITTKVG
jgi:mevalonate kinase